MRGGGVSLPEKPSGDAEITAWLFELLALHGSAFARGDYDECKRIFEFMKTEQRGSFTGRETANG